MDVELSRRLGRAFQHVHTIEEQDSIVDEAREVETWMELPDDIQDLVVEMEGRPYEEGVPPQDRLP